MAGHLFLTIHGRPRKGAKGQRPPKAEGQRPQVGGQRPKAEDTSKSKPLLNSLSIRLFRRAALQKQSYEQNRLDTSKASSRDCRNVLKHFYTTFKIVESILGLFSGMSQYHESILGLFFECPKTMKACWDCFLGPEKTRTQVGVVFCEPLLSEDKKGIVLVDLGLF